MHHSNLASIIHLGRYTGTILRASQLNNKYPKTGYNSRALCFANNMQTKLLQFETIFFPYLFRHFFSGEKLQQGVSDQREQL
jgi:hypothetical protein